MTVDFMNTPVDELNEQQLRDALLAVRGLVRITDRKADMALAAAEDAGRFSQRLLNLLSLAYTNGNVSVRAQLAPLFAWNNYTEGLTDRNVWTDRTPGGPEDVTLWKAGGVR